MVDIYKQVEKSQNKDTGLEHVKALLFVEALVLVESLKSIPWRLAQNRQRTRKGFKYLL